MEDANAANTPPDRQTTLRLLSIKKLASHAFQRLEAIFDLEKSAFRRLRARLGMFNASAVQNLKRALIFRQNMTGRDDFGPAKAAAAPTKPFLSNKSTAGPINHWGKCS